MVWDTDEIAITVCAGDDMKICSTLTSSKFVNTDRLGFIRDYPFLYVPKNEIL
jgi:hypothetical protein